MTDAELLERLREGSKEAFTELVRRHVDWVYSVARRRVRDEHLAEDVTQASFAVLFQKPPRLKAGQALPPTADFRPAGELAYELPGGERHVVIALERCST